MDTCIFCRIVKKEVPADVVYEDENILAFLDMKPVHPGHTLVIPKKHAENIFDVDAESWGHMADIARRIAPAIMQGVGAGGLNCVVNNKRAASQLVFHAHIHLIPRFEGDGFAAWHGMLYKDGEAIVTAEKIRVAYTSLEGKNGGERVLE